MLRFCRAETNRLVICIHHSELGGDVEIAYLARGGPATGLKKAPRPRAYISDAPTAEAKTAPEIFDDRRFRWINLQRLYVQDNLIWRKMGAYQRRRACGRKPTTMANPSFRGRDERGRRRRRPKLDRDWKTFTGWTPLQTRAGGLLSTTIAPAKAHSFTNKTEGSEWTTKPTTEGTAGRSRRYSSNIGKHRICMPKQMVYDDDSLWKSNSESRIIVRSLLKNNYTTVASFS